MTKKKKSKKIGAILLTLVLVIGLVLGSLLYLGRSKYERDDLVTVEGETEIDSHSDFFTQKWCNIHYRRMVAKFKSELKDNSKKVVFLGDSITEYFDLDKYFSDVSIFNMGISGDTTRGVLNRMDLVYEANPDAIFILLGINDFMNEERNVQNVYTSYKQIIDEIKTNLPNTKIYVISTYQGCDGSEYKLVKYKDDVNELNTKLAALVLSYQVGSLFGSNNSNISYIPVNSNLVDSSGTMNPLYTNDGCHPNDAGYVKIKEVLDIYLSQYKNK